MDIEEILLYAALVISIAFLLYRIKKRGGIKKWLIALMKEIVICTARMARKIIILGISGLTLETLNIGGWISGLSYIFIALIFILIVILLELILVVLRKYVPLPSFLKNYI